ncbi:MAG: tripartite tricarboxylate transporter permease [Candidatus Woesearchaeota archaeon]
MFIEILLAIALGVLAGTFTGLIPGIHVNLLTAMLVSSSVYLTNYFSTFELVIFILTMAITHTFIGSILSILFGAPDESQYLLALPGHKLVMKGKGLYAIYLTLVGSFTGLIFAIISIPLSIIGMMILAQTIRPYIGYILCVAILLLILFEPKHKRVAAFFFFSCAGLLGIFVFSLPNIQQPLLPILSGLFGVSLLLESIKTTSQLPTQETYFSKPSFTSTVYPSILSVIAGFFAAFLPGLGSSQSAIFATKFLREQKPEDFLLVVSGINTVGMCLSILTFYLFELSRNGAVVGVQELVGSVSRSEVIFIFCSLLIAASLSFVFAQKIARVFIYLIPKVSYVFLVYGIVLFIIFIVFFFDTFVGLLILATSTILGLSSARYGIAKHYLMGCLLIPTILFFLF